MLEPSKLSRQRIQIGTVLRRRVGAVLGEIRLRPKCVSLHRHGRFGQAMEESKNAGYSPLLKAVRYSTLMSSRIPATDTYLRTGTHTFQELNRQSRSYTKPKRSIFTNSLFWVRICIISRSGTFRMEPDHRISYIRGHWFARNAS
jgi:hypothetical protein